MPLFISRLPLQIRRDDDQSAAAVPFLYSPHSVKLHTLFTYLIFILHSYVCARIFDSKNILAFTPSILKTKLGHASLTVGIPSMELEW